jgi:4-amino-4-deoxy-L-arabinose transferase-like glycosyltransferase
MESILGERKKNLMESNIAGRISRCAAHIRENALWYAWGIVILSLLVRLYAAWVWNSHRPALLIGDEPGYDNLARDLLAGYGLTWPGRVPLYPLWLAAIYWVTDYSYTAVRYAQAFLGAGVVLLTYLLGTRLFGRSVGLTAASLATISYILVHQSLRLLSESLYTPALMLSTLAFWDALHTPRDRRFVWAGLWIGISNLIRPTLFLFPFFSIVVFFIYFQRRQAWRYWSIFVLVSMLTVLPWMVRNYIHYQAVYPLATSNAILWQGSPEYYRLIHDEGYTYLDIWTKVIYGPDSIEHDPGSVEGDRWWTQRALRSIQAEPLIYLRYSAEKLVTYWIGDPNADWADTYVFNYQALRSFGFSHHVAVQYMIARALPIFALLAILYLRRYWRLLLPLYIFLIYNTLLHAATHAEARLSEPSHPFLLILIAGALMVYVKQRYWPTTASQEVTVQKPETLSKVPV